MPSQQPILDIYNEAQYFVRNKVWGEQLLNTYLQRNIAEEVFVAFGGIFYNRGHV
jgi:hypothetical protein